MATTTTIQEATDAALDKSEKLQKQKEKEMATRVDDKPRKSKCNALGKLPAAALVGALALLGHTIHQNEKLQHDLTPPYSSIPTAVLNNMTDELATLRKQNVELHQAQDTLNKLLENNPLDRTKPYSIEQRIHKEVKKAAGEEEEEDTSKAVVKSKGRKKGGYFNEHFNLTF